ncbi:MAG: peroxidase-related enzyme [Acidimicrobiia bacterium]
MDAYSTLNTAPKNSEPYGWLACPDEYQLPEQLRPRVPEQGSLRILGYYEEGDLERMAPFIGPIFGDPEYGVLTLAEREFIGVVISAVNCCVTCLLIHTDKLGELIGDHGRARRLSINYRTVSLSAEERAIADFCIKVTERPGRLEQADVQVLRDVGLSDAKIYYVVQTAAAFNFTNRMTSAFGMRPDDDFLARLAPRS